MFDFKRDFDLILILIIVITAYFYSTPGLLSLLRRKAVVIKESVLHGYHVGIIRLQQRRIARASSVTSGEIHG
jgi:hypothetical protein